MTLMGARFLTVVMVTAANYETIAARMRPDARGYINT